jgi:predicted enzyme related to lactoylglutathione lyase
MPDPVVHFEVTGKDVAKLRKFYADIFGWKTNTDNPAHYALVPTAARASTAASRRVTDRSSPATSR